MDLTTYEGDILRGDGCGGMWVGGGIIGLLLGWGGYEVGGNWVLGAGVPYGSYSQQMVPIMDPIYKPAVF